MSNTTVPSTVVIKKSSSFANFTILVLVAVFLVSQVMHVEKVHQLEAKVMKAEFEAQIAKKELEQAKLALANALIPEATVTEAMKNHVVVPVKEAVASAWNTTKDTGSHVWTSVKGVFQSEPEFHGMDWETVKASVRTTLAEIKHEQEAGK
jgi:hypothetical protein